LPATLETLTLTHCDKKAGSANLHLGWIVESFLQGHSPSLKQVHHMGSSKKELANIIGRMTEPNNWQTTHWGRKARADGPCCMEHTETRALHDIFATPQTLTLALTDTSVYTGGAWRDGYERLKQLKAPLDYFTRRLENRMNLPKGMLGKMNLGRLLSVDEDKIISG
jgi:hypothetical protein